MSYEHKEPLPQYGAQSPSPMSPQMYSQPAGQSYTTSPPPPQIDRSPSGQYHQQPTMQQVPQQGQYAQNPLQGQMPQQPQMAYNQAPQQGYPMQQANTGGQGFATVIPLASLTSSPAPVQCPGCGQRGMTRTAFVVGNTTHGWAAGLCAVLCLGCIPYLVSSMKDVEHRCGNCGCHLATWHRSGRTEPHMFT